MVVKKRGMSDRVAEDIIATYELVVVHGVSGGEARKKVTEILL